MAFVTSMEGALLSRDRINLVERQGLGWEVHDNVLHRTLSIHFDKAEAELAYKFHKENKS